MFLLEYETKRERITERFYKLTWSDDLKTLPRNQKDTYSDQIFRIYQFLGEIYFS